MLSTPRAFALLSFPFSVLMQVSPGLFHHLSYSIWISPFSCSSRIARDILSRHGEPVEFLENHIPFWERAHISIYNLIVNRVDFFCSIYHWGCTLLIWQMYYINMRRVKRNCLNFLSIWISKVIYLNIVTEVEIFSQILSELQLMTEKNIVIVG